MKKLTKAISLIAGIITCSQTAIMGMYLNYEKLIGRSDSEITTIATNFFNKLDRDVKNMSPDKREERFYELVYYLTSRSQDIIDAAIQEETKIVKLQSRTFLEWALNVVKNAVKAYKDSGRKINLSKDDDYKMATIISEITCICMRADLLSLK